MRLLPLFAAGILLLSGCAGAPPASRPATGPAPTRPGITARPGAVVPSPSEVTGTRFIRVLLTSGASGIVLE
ncbi:MAG: hypothetical protein IH610_07545, partial [Deltaproteobacteria bacterium]|nr:hypothetical protein [Deltaproteobacteria bacterium]